MGNKVLMVSGSDEHGTPITVAAESQGISPQQVVDEFHHMNMQALVDLGCSWAPALDVRGPNLEVHCSTGPATPNTNAWCKKISPHWKKAVSSYVKRPNNTTNSIQTAPDASYRTGTWRAHVACGADGARGDQCDACGATYEAVELKNPESKLNPKAEVKYERQTTFSTASTSSKKPSSSMQPHNKRYGNPMSKTTPRIGWTWGFSLVPSPRFGMGHSRPLGGEDWASKCVYVWFEAVQGYSTCAYLVSTECQTIT